RLGELGQALHAVLECFQGQDEGFPALIAFGLGADRVLVFGLGGVLGAVAFAGDPFGLGPGRLQAGQEFSGGGVDGLTEGCQFEEFFLVGGALFGQFPLFTLQGGAQALDGFLACGEVTFVLGGVGPGVVQGLGGGGELGQCRGHGLGAGVVGGHGAFGCDRAYFAAGGVDLGDGGVQGLAESVGRGAGRGHQGGAVFDGAYGAGDGGGVGQGGAGAGVVLVLLVGPGQVGAWFLQVWGGVGQVGAGAVVVLLLLVGPVQVGA